VAGSSRRKAGRRVWRFTGRRRIARGALRHRGCVDRGVLVLRNGRAVAVVALTIRDGLIAQAHAHADPAVFAAVTATLRR
jgi:hypothetical protein